MEIYRQSFKAQRDTSLGSEGEVGAANVDVALSLVGYDAGVEAAMKYVFGGNFVCPDMDAARKVTFNDKIKTKAVTLDGDLHRKSTVEDDRH